MTARKSPTPPPAEEEVHDAEIVDEAMPDAVMHENVSSSAVALPTTSDFNEWSDEEKALADAAGLVARKPGKAPEIAPRAVIAAFLHQCRRTGLDPIARQIYCIERAGKWQTQISIDGFRLIAQRSGEYAGQTPIQWTGDGREWFDVWLFDTPPRAARVGVYRRGFAEALFAVARWDSYAPMVPMWSGGKKTGEKLSPMWEKMPDLMLGKVAEMLALRRAFPQELAGLYGTEEMDQAHAAPTPAQQRAVVQKESTKQANDDAADKAWLAWKAAIDGADSLDRIAAVREQAEKAGILGLVVPGSEDTVFDYIAARADAVQVQEEDYVVDQQTGEIIDGSSKFKNAQSNVQRGNAQARLQAGLKTDGGNGK